MRYSAYLSSPELGEMKTTTNPAKSWRKKSIPGCLLGFTASFLLHPSPKAAQVGKNSESHDHSSKKVQLHEDLTTTVSTRLNALRDEVDKNSIRMSLDQCLENGIKQNMQLAAAYASIQQQEYSLIGLKRQYIPTLSLTSLPPFLGAVQSSSSAKQYQQVVTINPNGTTQITTKTQSSQSSLDYNQIAPYFTLTWSFFQPTLPASIKASNADVRRQRLAFDVTARSAVLQIQQAYYQLQTSKALIDAFERIYRINLEQVNYVKERQKVGLTNIGAVEQAKSQLYVQMNQLISFYDNYIQAAASLALAMNQPMGKLIIPSENISQSSPWQESLENTVNVALRLREEIQAYLESEQASIWNARATVRQYLPTLMLQGFAYSLLNNGTADAAVTYDTSYNFKAIGLGITWNIFDGGVAAAQAQSLKAQSRNARYQAEYTKFLVQEQVKQAFASYKTAILSLETAKLNLDAANKTIQVNRARFSVGLADITSLVQSMQLLGQASEAYSNSLLQYNNAIAELYRYSAQWPTGMRQVINNRKESLKKATD